MKKRRIIAQWSLLFDSWTILHSTLRWSMNKWFSLRITNFVFTLRHVSISTRRRKNGGPMEWKWDLRPIVTKRNAFPCTSKYKHPHQHQHDFVIILDRPFELWTEQDFGFLAWLFLVALNERSLFLLLHLFE